MRLRKGTKIRWKSRGPKGAKMREGVVRAYLRPGDKISLPPEAKCKVAVVNTVHARYLIEIRRENKRSGKRLPSHWLAPKAVALERVVKVLA